MHNLLMQLTRCSMFQGHLNNCKCGIHCILFPADVGQRAHVGKVNMDHELTAETTLHSVEETRRSV